MQINKKIKRGVIKTGHELISDLPLYVKLFFDRAEHKAGLKNYGVDPVDININYSEKRKDRQSTCLHSESYLYLDKFPVDEFNEINIINDISISRFDGSGLYAFDYRNKFYIFREGNLFNWFLCNIVYQPGSNNNPDGD